MTRKIVDNIQFSKIYLIVHLNNGENESLKTKYNST